MEMETNLDSALLLADLEIALDKLSPAAYRIVTLHYFCGYSIKEIAKEYNLSERAIRNRLSKAKEALRVELQKGDE